MGWHHLIEEKSKFVWWGPLSLPAIDFLMTLKLYKGGCEFRRSFNCSDRLNKTYTQRWKNRSKHPKTIIFPRCRLFIYTIRALSISLSINQIFKHKLMKLCYPFGNIFYNYWNNVIIKIVWIVLSRYHQNVASFYTSI